MPPKDGSGKKMTQKEKDRRKKEAEELRLREEEAARLQAEREERERKEREKQEEIERKKQENEENITRKVELLDLNVIMDTNRSAIKFLKEESRRKLKWNRYLRCDGSPDPTVAGEINSYLSLWREDDTRIDLKSVLNDSVLTVSLLDELDRVISITPSEEMSEKQLLQYHTTNEELRSLLKSKLDRACHELLCRASELADAETANLQTVHSNSTGSITVCMWGNLSKNQRIKQHEFAEKGFTFDIPRVVILSDSAVRVLFTSYDHYSPQSASYLPRRKHKEVTLVEEPEVVEEKPVEVEPVSAPPEPTEAADKDKDDIMAALYSLDGDPAAEAQAVVAEEPVEKPAEEIIIEEDLVKTPEPPEWDDFDGDADDIDLREFQVVGDVIQFDLLQLPPQPKQMRGWTMTVSVRPPELVTVEYVADQFIATQQQALMTAMAQRESAMQPSQSGMATTPGPGTSTTSRLTTAHAGRQSDIPVPSSAVSVNAAAVASEPPLVPQPVPESATQRPAESSRDAKASAVPAAAEKKEEKPLINVVIKLQPGVVFCDTPVVGVWDSKRKSWKRDIVNDVVFKEIEKEIQFATPMFGVLALMQDKHINMPFQTWNLRPRAETDSCILTIIASISELSIEIKDNKCCLCEPQENKLLRVYLNKWCTVDELKQMLQRAGVNIFPDCDSDKFVSTQDKNAIAVERLYQQMALLSTSVAFSWSRWNAEMKRTDTVIIQACEHLKDEPVAEDAYSLYAATRKKVVRLKMNEFADNLSDELDETASFHADFYHMYVKEFGTENGIQRVQDTNYQYVDTVNQLLKATHVLIYS